MVLIGGTLHDDLGGVRLRHRAKNAGAPLVALAAPGEYGATWLARLVELVILLDMLAVYIGVSVSAARGVRTMARDGWLPRPFGIFCLAAIYLAVVLAGLACRVIRPRAAVAP